MRRKSKVDKLKIGICALAIYLLVILLFVGVRVYTRNEFNAINYVTSGSMQSNNANVSINSHGGDSLTKTLEDGTELNAQILNIEIVNNGEYDIGEWEFRLNINEDCYINGAWPGNIEIHQNVVSDEKEQIVNFETVKDDEFDIDYIKYQDDYMIPLKQGDYIIYHPDKKLDEYPIKVKKPDDVNANKVAFGGSIYYGSNRIDFSNYTLSYHLSREVFHGKDLIIFIIMIATWFVGFASLITVIVCDYFAKKRYSEDEKVIEESLGVFTSFFDAKDRYTEGHSKRVAQYSKMIAEEIGMPKEDCKRIFYIGLMHDCGKCYIPDEILKKPCSLSEEEYEIIKSHPLKGVELLRDFNSIEGIRDGALYHHERYDGTGYPTRKAGADIPLVGRIIAVADAFDAMNSYRCYRDKLPKDVIIEELKTNSGTQFDPMIADALLDLIYDNRVEIEDD